MLLYYRRESEIQISRRSKLIPKWVLAFMVLGTQRCYRRRTMDFGKNQESTKDTLASVCVYPRRLQGLTRSSVLPSHLSFHCPYMAQVSSLEKKKQAEAPETVTSPKVFLAVKMQTIYAMTSKQFAGAEERRNVTNQTSLAPTPAPRRRFHVRRRKDSQ